ncbi:interferon alpha-1-like [Megalops cyprinoides]|uniref:interferon alpha-1-like n=1 Tax=Megalops cyprinoides TaxID=118141 RepID=UPI001863DB8E|nr:interferon alpha-1-like [Megalops cyprinoides]
MALQSFVWLCALLCNSMVWSVPIRCQLEGNLVQTSHSLLKDVGGHFPLQCIKENVFIAFPSTAFASNGTAEQTDDVKMAIYETLHRINSLFDNDNTPAQWDQKKLEDFQNIIYRLVEESKCMTGRNPGNEDTQSPVFNRISALRTYFDSMARILQEKNDSFCAWEIIRRELVRTLHFILEHCSGSLRWSRRI